MPNVIEVINKWNEMKIVQTIQDAVNTLINTANLIYL